MKQPQQIALIGMQTSFAEVWQWGQKLERVHARLEPRIRALAVEHVGEARPDEMQRLLNQAVWYAGLVRDDPCRHITEHLGHLSAVIVIYETSFRKRGSQSAGVDMLSRVCGKVAEARVSPQKRIFLAEAMQWYREAEAILASLQARVELSEIYRRMAQILERTNQHEEAIASWKAAYVLNAPSE